MSAAGVAGIAVAIVVIAIAAIILTGVEAIAAATVVIGEIMYPDYHNSDNHDDPEGLIPLEKAETSAIIIARTHRKFYLLNRFLNTFYLGGDTFATINF